MLSVLGSPQRLCDGWSRREMLRIGGLGLFGLGLPDLFRAREMQAATPAKKEAASFGKAKSCILLFLYGSPSQLETFDPKPDAPKEIRGELGVIKSNVPGTLVGELLPYSARVMDKLTVLRSMTHQHPIHGAAFALTGVPTIDVPMELNPRDARHWPFIGSVVEYLDQQRLQGRKPAMPSNLALPFPFSSQRTGEVHRAGPYAAFLGNAYNPIWTHFQGKATVKTNKTLAPNTIEVAEPYMGIDADCRFDIASGDGLPAEMTLDRLDKRRSLMDQFDRARRLKLNEKSFDRYRGMALDLVTSVKVKTALDVKREPRAVRDSYGMTVFGQGCLAARRLVEAGTHFVSVFWDEYGLAGSAWDTHWEHYPRMKNELCPGFDRALFGLLTDLDQRGMLDETLVVCVSEHGRTPQMNNAKGGGRDHWSRAYSALLAGGGIARGKVIGKTDKIAGDVVADPISPKDILATTYHLLGFDLETTIEDRIGRPMHIAPNASVITEALA